MLVRAAYRVLAAAQITAYRVDRVLAEVVLALHDPRVERHALDRHYELTRTYVENQDAGLLPLEARAVDRYFPAPPARVLVPGMGGGREVVALLRRGYAVTGFDPVPSYVEAARAATASWPEVRLERATLQQWARDARGRYDAVLTGWALWGHVMAQEDRLAALRAFREVCPGGPVLLSFHRGEDVFDEQERATLPGPLHPRAPHPVQRAIQRLLRERLLGRPPLERGTVFRNGTFFHVTNEAEIEEESARCGYRVACYERDASKFPHAVLLPAAGEPGCHSG